MGSFILSLALPWYKSANKKTQKIYFIIPILFLTIKAINMKRLSIYFGLYSSDFSKMEFTRLKK
ncbi:MAG: hypothetical protein C0407_01590 [Desulfobacca sp.]|nr:hypothetical protein [Desulfobacca sp.]